MRLFATEHAFTGIDISSKAFWAQPFDVREETFARLRAEAPVSWHPAKEWHEEHGQAGFWAVTRADDIAAVSLDSAAFMSGHGTVMDPVDPVIAAMGTFILGMDPPRHTRYRRLISAAFTPKAVARLSSQIAVRARDIASDLVGAGDIEFVQDCASRLPMATVSDLVGVPEADRARVALAADRLVGGADLAGKPIDEVFVVLAEEFRFLLDMGQELAAYRREHPADDLMTGLVQASVDGEGLSDEDIGAFLVLLSVAGNDTTKQTTSLGMLGLQQHPAERAWLLEDLDGRIGTAVEELSRWVSPVMQFARTATRDLVLGDARISEADKVVVFYCSGNRDGERFTDPGRLDLKRDPNRHQAFGGGGAHYCLGNGLARTQLRAIFTELLTRVPGLELGAPVQLESDFINGVSALPAHAG